MLTPVRAVLVCALGLSLPLAAQEVEKPRYDEKYQKKAASAASAQRQKAQELADAGRWVDAAAAFEKAIELDPEDARSRHMLGFSLHAAGELDRALQAHLEAAKFDEVRPVATYNVACVYALKGEREKALKWLEKAAEAGFDNADHLASDPDMDNLRDDPRFKKITEKMAAASNGGGALRVFSSTTPRQSARVLFWAGKGSPGQVVIDYGQPVWNDKYSKALASPELERRRWRMGRDFWTTLDTNIALKVGGVKVPAGYYYAVLEHVGEGQLELVLLDPAEVRNARLDAYLAHQSVGGIAIPMHHEQGDEVADRLGIGIEVDKSHQTRGVLRVRFGPHVLSAKVAMALE